MKRLEYLESTGTQYIDTNFKPSISTDVEIKVEVTVTNTKYIFGVVGSDLAHAFAQQSSENRLIFMYKSTTNNTSYRAISSIAGYNTGVHVMKTFGKDFYVDNEYVRYPNNKYFHPNKKCIHFCCKWKYSKPINSERYIIVRYGIMAYW